MKFFKNNADDIVKEAVSGLVKSNPNLGVLASFPEIKVVVRKDWDKSKVAIVSGGGSGHEPSHAGFVGQGMLTAAVCGEVFASPSVDAVLSAIVAVTGEKGCLLVVKNYTGDRLNFGLAAEQAKAMGLNVEMVVINDDVALGINKNSRGIAGTVFVHKIAGAVAELGGDLATVKNVAQKVNEQTFSLGLSLTECQRFTAESDEGRIAADKVELGLGIHGEPGANIINYQSANNLVNEVVTHLQSAIPATLKGTYAIMVNNLGTATPLEMNIITQALANTELGKNATYIVGPAPIMTALNMNGFSLSVIYLDAELESALLQKTTLKTWPDAQKWNGDLLIEHQALPKTIQTVASDNQALKAIVEQLANNFIAIESDINYLDSQVGDGDAGTTFATSGKNILKYSKDLPYADPATLLETIGRILSRESGGSSGVLLSILFTATGNAYKQEAHWGKAFLNGLAQMNAYGGAKVGSRTMVDALQPLFEAWAKNESQTELVAAARVGADSTKAITKTDFGRSSYVPASVLHNIPDPGAEAIAKALELL